MYLGEQTKQCETLQNEYKEFCIKSNIFKYYTQEELDYIIKTGKLAYNFNNMILDNIKMYCNIYVPKYASAFANSNINDGNIQIGVNDNGEITGIPFFGNLDKSHITNLVNNAKNKYLLNKVITKVTVTKLKYCEKLISDNTDEIIQKTTKHNKICKMIQDNYYYERKNWVSEVLKYAVRLSHIIKNDYTRQKFYNWLKSKDCKIYSKIVQTKWKDIENIENKREQISNDKCIIHWIAMYKDETMVKLQSMKPEYPNITKYYNSSVCLMTQLTDMRSKFITNNKKIKYYKVNIYFIPDIQNVEYKKYNRQDIFKSYRRDRSGLGPYSATYIKKV